jgi:serine/threonine-protein kinase
LNRDVAEARELGSYRLHKLLGKGGMGEVWRAVHRLLARPAAIKLILPRAHESEKSSPGGSLVQRFEREAKATASLQSPNTVALYDFGRTDEGTFYYVMELLDGLDLESLVNRFGPMPAERAVAILKQACKSLAEAHDAGLVHRDVKPANIMVCRYGREFDFVKVLDFGLVALQTKHASEDLKLTADGIAGGTPAYMPPEIAEGKQIDGRTDLYALGCVAYWMLTGRTVFEGDTPMAVILSHVSDAPRPMAERSEVEIPKELDEIVMACLEKSPDQRPRSADELLARLERCPQASPWNAEKARNWWETHRPKTAAQAVSED